MKKTLLIIVLTMSVWSLKAQEMQTFTELIDSTFKYVKRTDANTGILYERVLSLAGLTRFNSNISSVDTCDFRHFMQGYHELYVASFLPSILPCNVDSLENIIKTRTYKVDIGFIHFKFNTFDTNIMRQKLFFDMDSNLREDTTILTSLYTENTIFMASPFIKAINNTTVNFYLSDTFYFENTNNAISQIDIDFDDGLGFRTVIFNSTVSISYVQDGEKIIRFQAILTNGDSLFAFAKININLLPQNANKPSNHPYYDDLIINAQIAHPNNYSSGYFGKNSGVVKIYYKDLDKQLRNPILIVDGFDPENMRRIETYFNPHDPDKEGYSIWELLYYKDENNDSIHIGKKLINDLGYDLIILDFSKGGDTIEKNAMVCIEVINEINRRLIVSGSQNEIVIIGPSMGGQITRYALAYMEKHPNDVNTNYGKHNCRLWVSLDSPHQGANISMGAQAFIQYFNGIKTARYIWENTICCSAAKQMLIHHKLSGAGSVHNIYYNGIRNLGYPENLRKIAISNGSLNNTANGTAHQIAFEAVVPALIYTMDIRIRNAVNSGQGEVFSATHWIGFIPIHITWTFTNNTGKCSPDVAPGGTYNTFDQLRDAIEKIKVDVIQTNQHTHCFMPTTSVLDISENYDYCTDFSNRDLVAEGKTPFNSYWGPVGKNMYHITFDKNLADYLINEIETYIEGEKTINFCEIKPYNIHLPSGQENTNVTWDCSENLSIVSGQNTQNVHIQATGDGEAWICVRADNLTHSNQLGKFYITITGTNTYENVPLLSSGNHEWNQPYQLLETLHIFSGATLTIKSTLYCSPAAKIVVYPGGKLIIDGGILTNICDNDLWKGIEVLGNPSLSQDLNNTNQGILILQNGAIIQNAVCGVYVGERNTISISINGGTIISIPDGFDEPVSIATSGGGIVSATNSLLLNNKQAVNFQDYTHIASNNFELDNRSSFINCTFTVNNDALFIVENGESQVFLNGVKGVKFNGCLFEDAQAKSSLNNYGIGIYSYNAGVCINDNRSPFSPIPYITNTCSFTGYGTAILLKNSGTRPVRIYNTSFASNQTSVNALSSYALTMQMCNVFNSQSGYFPSLYGLVLNKCDNYSVANNIFHGDGTGILFLGEVLNNNHIRNNTFNDMCVACYVEGVQGIDNSCLPSIGLKFSCNLFDNNDEDIKITENSFISSYQGYYSTRYYKYYGTGNQFGNPNISLMNIDNCNNNFGIWYYYDLNGYNQTPINCNNVNPPNPNIILESVQGNKCNASGYMGENYYSTLTIVPISELNDMYLDVFNEFNSLKTEYINVYGSTNIVDIIHAQGLPNMPGINPQFDMYAELTELKDSLTIICQNALQLLLTSEELNKSEYNTWLYRCENIDADYVLAESYFTEGDITQMNATLDSILIKYPNGGMNENLQYKTCLNYLCQWASTDIDSLLISQGAIDTLLFIASGSNRASVKAEAMLERFGKDIVIQWEPDRCNWWVIGNAPSGNKNENSVEETKTTLKQDMILIPNPASNELTVDNGQINMQEIYIYDVVGKEVKRFSINQEKATLIISELSPGVYVLKAKTKTGIETKKFIKD